MASNVQPDQHRESPCDGRSGFVICWCGHEVAQHDLAPFRLYVCTVDATPKSGACAFAYAAGHGRLPSAGLGARHDGARFRRNVQHPRHYYELAAGRVATTSNLARTPSAVLSG